ncbi:hypothetical protein SHYC_05460 [Staphylococcus hyicus]|nr:hypothetical protein SHYC_05460 [Staphylococcus hyicus]
MKEKYKRNLLSYLNALPLAGLISSLFLLVMNFFIFKVTENLYIVALYCLLPFIIFSLLSIIYKWLFYKQHK